MFEPNPTQFRYVLSIDVGIHHMAFVLLEVEKDYSQSTVVWFELMDITTFYHLDLQSKKQCKLFHSRTLSDWMSHIFSLNTELFDLCETVLIERQPPGGQIAVEQLLFFNYRSKAVLIHPRSVHAFFGWTEDYEGRKRRSVQIFEHALEKNPRTWLKGEFATLRRRHDISDAYTQAIFYFHKKHVEYRTCRQSHSTLPQPIMDALTHLEQYRFDEFDM
jgi:hypothetical protein